MSSVTPPLPPVPAPAALEPEIRAWAAPFVGAAGPSFRALYLFGSALAPGFDPAVSDVNLLFVLAYLPFERLDTLAFSLGAATGAGGRLRFTPLFLTETQLRTSADIFPLEFLDLTQRRALLEGTDLLAEVSVSHENLRHQCEYELSAKLVGLRQAYLRAAGAAGVAHRLLTQAAGGSAALFRHLLTLRAAARPDDPEGVARAVAAVYGVDALALAAPFAARRSPAPAEAEAHARLAGYLSALEALVAAVDALPEG